ncbi:Uveal autoantigen with coiled-coil domains and [Echinococcus granulosus]|uniref:Uveal autoantigen with coiled-coil domains and n=1 Tax=Echinococcus granulosus TaxID=6210 RepID=W6U5N6_ECHGR|nr:Uveal autoantigen with coiled-coil domains and [Echinococcus granulosus]EUB55906.1 Uveal autoantigen with coiled-coil domains and [Echinococcus granulosus]
MLESLKSENEILHADHEDLISKFQSSEREWLQRYHNLTEELRTQQRLQLQTESNRERTEDESSLVENAQKYEISELQKHLSEAQSRIALLETELNATSCREVITVGTATDPSMGDAQEFEARSHFSPTPPPRTRSILNTDSSKRLSELITSPKVQEYTELLRRYNAARLIIEDLMNKNVSLNKELSTCKQDLTGCQSKLADLSEQLQTERALHAENLEEYRKEVQGLQDRISDLLGDRDRCEALTTELNHLKENEARLKREHARQLQNLDKMLQERDIAVYDLMTGRTATPEQINDKVIPEEVNSATQCILLSLRFVFILAVEETICAEEPASEIEDPVQNVVDPLHISGGILDKTIQELQVALKRLQSEISVMETSELCSMPRGDEGGCVTTAAFHSVDRLKEVRLIIQSLLSHFDSIRAMKLSLSRTINRSLLVNASVEVGCDLRQIHSAVLPLQVGDEEDDENVLTLSHSTFVVTTIDHLKNGGDAMATEKDAEATFDISCEDVKSLDVSAIEAQNRVFFDRVTLAVAKIQDAVEDFSFRAATEVLTALASQPVEDVKGDGDGEDVEDDHEDNVEYTQTRTETGTRTPSVSADTLANISRPHTGFSEIAEEEAFQKGMLSKNCQLRCLDPANGFHDINFNLINDLLTRFFDMMAHVQTLAVAEINSLGRVSASSVSSAFGTADDNHNAFAEWSSKGREWLKQFIAALQNASMLPLIQSNLEVLECEFIDNFPHLNNTQKKIGKLFQEKDAQTSRTDSTLPQEDYEALAAKCDRLSVLNVELQNAHILLSEEWSAARRQYEATLADLRATCDELRSELERSEDTARERNRRIDELEVDTRVFYLPRKLFGISKTVEVPVVFIKDRLTEANTHAANLLEELDQTRVTIMNLRERLEQADNEVTRHRCELEQFMVRAQSVTKVDGTAPPSPIAVFDCLLAGLEGRIQSAVEERKEEEENRVQHLTSSFEVKVNGLEEEMQKQVEMLYMDGNAHFPDEERCETLAFREQELNAELETKEAELEHLRQDYQTLQAEVDILRCRAMNAERAISEELAEKARKYPELKAIAMDLKSRLFKRAELLEHSLNEAKRLRRIIRENDARAKEFLEELERLRMQILAKNSSIRQLERLAQQCSGGRVKPSPSGRKSEPDLPKSPSSECLGQSPRQASPQVTTPSTRTNVSGGEEELDSLCSVTRRSFLVDSTHKSTNTSKTASTKAPSAITVPVAVIAREDEAVRTVSSGLVYSAHQYVGASRPLLLEPCGVEPLRRHPSSTTAGETISIVDVDHDEELDGSVGGMAQSFDSKEEASLAITSSNACLLVCSGVCRRVNNSVCGNYVADGVRMSIVQSSAIQCGPVFLKAAIAWVSGDLTNTQIFCLQCLEGLRYNPTFPHLAACLYFVSRSFSFLSPSISTLLKDKERVS